MFLRRLEGVHICISPCTWRQGWRSSSDSFLPCVDSPAFYVLFWGFMFVRLPPSQATNTFPPFCHGREEWGSVRYVNMVECPHPLPPLCSKWGTKHLLGSAAWNVRRTPPVCSSFTPSGNWFLVQGTGSCLASWFLVHIIGSHTRELLFFKTFLGGFTVCYWDTILDVH